MTAIVAGMLVGLLAQQASAEDEIVAYGSESAQGLIRAEIAGYIRTLNEELRATLDENRQREVEKVELASNRDAPRA